MSRFCASRFTLNFSQLSWIFFQQKFQFIIIINLIGFPGHLGLHFVPEEAGTSDQDRNLDASIHRS